MREKLKVVVDEVVADKAFKAISGGKHSFDREAWVATLTQHDYVGDFDVIEAKIRELVKDNATLCTKLEVNDATADDTLEL